MSKITLSYIILLGICCICFGDIGGRGSPVLVGATLGWVSALRFLCMLGGSMVMAETDAHPARRRREYLSAVRFLGKGWIQLGSARTWRVEEGKAGRGKQDRGKKIRDFLHQVCLTRRLIEHLSPG